MTDQDIPEHLEESLTSLLASALGGRRRNGSAVPSWPSSSVLPRHGPIKLSPHSSRLGRSRRGHHPTELAGKSTEARCSRSTQRWRQLTQSW